MKEVTTGKGTFIFVPVPKESRNHQIIQEYLWFNLESILESDEIKLPPGKHRFIGVYPGMGESEAMEVVESKTFRQAHDWSLETAYKSYTHSSVWFNTALESIPTLMEANKIYLVNPYGEKEPKFISGGAPELIIVKARKKKWQEAQSNVSPLWVVIKKEN